MGQDPLRSPRESQKNGTSLWGDRKRPRCIGELPRAELTQAPRRPPRQRQKEPRIPLCCRRKHPRCVGKLLRAELAHAQLRRWRQCRQDYRIPLGCHGKRPRCNGEILP